MRADGAELPSPMSVEQAASSFRLADSSIGVFIDPLSYHFARDRLFEQHTYGDFHLPWLHVKQLLEARGFPVHTAGYLLEGELAYDVNFYFAIGNVKNYKKLAGCDDVVLSGLFHIEAPIVHPTTYRETPEASRHFRRVFSFSSPEALAPFGCAGLSFTKFRIPEPYDGIDGTFDELWARDDRRFLCMISQNKLPTLSYKELYTERLRLLQHFAQTDSIDLYGIGWEQLPFRVGEPKSWVLRELERIRRYVWERLPFTRNHPYQDVIKKVRKLIGTPALTPHKLRHLMLNDLVRAGMELHEVSYYAGHASVESLNPYLHPQREEVARHVRKASKRRDEQVKRLIEETTSHE